MSTNTHHSDLAPQLSLFVGNQPQSYSPLSADLAHTFEKATGWVLEFQECSSSIARRKKPGMQHSPPTGKLQIADMSAQLEPEERPLHRGNCDAVVEQLDHVFAELQRTKVLLQAAQAELATQVPVVVEQRDSEQLAELLAALLDAAAKSVGLQTAGLYLLDQDTEFLNLRANIGAKQFTNQQRLLATCPADIEALAGHAIVISESMQSRIWSAPEECASAVCVPVGSMNTILGSLWIMGDTPRQFSDAEVNVIEIIAGRIAAELERAAIVRQSTPVAPAKSKRTSDQEMDLAKPIDPPFEGWSFAGLVGREAKRFIDWDISDEEQLVLVVGKDDETMTCFVDPITSEIQLIGESELVQFWLYDADNVMLQRFRGESPVRRLVTGQSIIASTTSDMQRVSTMLATHQYRDRDDFMVVLNRQ